MGLYCDDDGIDAVEYSCCSDDDDEIIVNEENGDEDDDEEEEPKTMVRTICVIIKSLAIL